MTKTKMIVILVVMVLLIPPSMIVASWSGKWKDLRTYKAPDGSLSLRVQTYVPTFSFFDPGREREMAFIDHGGWDYPAVFQIQYTDDKGAWIDKCTVEWKENEVLLKTPDGYAIHLYKDYNPERTN